MPIEGHTFSGQPLQRRPRALPLECSAIDRPWYTGGIEYGYKLVLIHLVPAIGEVDAEAQRQVVPYISQYRFRVIMIVVREEATSRIRRAVELRYEKQRDDSQTVVGPGGRRYEAIHIRVVQSKQPVQSRHRIQP